MAIAIKKEKTKFAPVREVLSEEDHDNYTKFQDTSKLEWFCRTSNHKKFKSHSLWKAVKNPTETRIETQTLYFTDLTNDKCGFIQLLYSSVMGGIYKGFQLNFKIFKASSKDESEENIDIWESFKIENIKDFDTLKVESDNVSFHFVPLENPSSNGFAQLLIKIDIPKGSTSSLLKDLKVDVTVNLQEGFIINPDGSNYYLDNSISLDELSKRDPSSTSRRMVRHVFVPRGFCNGTISYKKKDKLVKLDLNDTPMLYLDAVQGLIPNKAASKWNFLCFNGRKRSMMCIEFTTTKEYGSTTVTIWAVSDKEKILEVGSSVNDHAVKFPSTQEDKQNGWKYPTSIAFPRGFEESNLRLVNRYDIMGEVPAFIRSIAENLANMKPFIYQFCQRSKFEDDEGVSIIESTFIN
ncbi:uncharacterized protein SKDI_12G2580 [Saccharomyces kudriavzevii IFO 1802]|uniref:Uncharacterized protein n=3 Tax=Saccharomyces TaxID=4930 RepID=A0AA35J2I0_SACK1|nr:uncharacterized protein SKDI_12G2580 [Saccharomyces kudriavzevii IFO 1802]EJT44285.1 YLR225C-like protein [Saccharomyces kudriavzevii IFO 1802]CAI4046456.1 hypothetical protein SKDI_12G2580 [Saccharomyces kudriavzevii IFO 1802]